MSNTRAVSARHAGERRVPRALSATGGALGAALIVLVSLLSGFGWLYLFRGLHWFGIGPPVADSLPLLQLAGFDGQALLRVALAWLLAGGLAGVALIRLHPARRAIFAGVLALLLLLIASQVVYALARNLRFSAVVLSRRPGFGPVLEALAFAAGCALPRPVAWLEARRGRRLEPVRMLSGLRHSSLGGGEDRNAAEDDGNRQQVSEHHGGARA